MRTTEVFPTLAGLKWGRKRSPAFKTEVQQAMSGREYRIPYRDYPLWNWELSYEVLRDDANDELKTLVGFFLRHRGSFASFRFLDPDDFSVTAHVFSASSTYTTASRIQLTRPYGNFYEPVTDPQPGWQFFVDGVANTSISIDINGIITPTASFTGVLSWTGSFWHRVRFAEDETEFEQFLEKLWSARRVSLVSAR